MEIEKKELEEIVYQKLKKLPEFFQRKLENVEFFVEDGHSTKFLGLYHGVPFGKRTNYNLVMPDKIIIYRRAFESACKNKKELEKKVEEVLLHEIGHYFGFDEQQLKNLGY
ncbi:MAG TPA: metallopeptidase family protein [bacterium]|nr:metallopeptidase family protein [bacterium]HOL34722.1 metallopeptidase family protein [bacterium]HPP08025.1 metallopeptidase family protein [bacterium]